MDIFTLAIYVILVFTLILSLYLRVQSHYTVLSMLTGAYENYPTVRIALFIEFIMAAVLTIVSFGLVALVIYLLAFLATRQVVGFIFFQLAVESKSNDLIENLRWKDNEEHKDKKARKLAEDEVWNQIKSNLGSN